MPSFTLLFRGAAVGTLEAATAGEGLGGNLSRLPGFEVLQDAISEASRALTKLGFLRAPDVHAGGVSASGDSAGAEVFAVAQSLCDELELRDARGELVPTDWINVFGGRSGDDPLAVLARLGLAPSGVLAAVRRPIGGDSGREPQTG